MAIAECPGIWYNCGKKGFRQMNRKSFMRPKRASALPSLSRDDAQIDARSYLFRDGIKFNTVAFPGKDGSRRYRLKLERENDNISELSALEEQLRTSGLTVRVEVIENILDVLCAIIPEYIAQTGKSVRLGNLVTLKPYATGSLLHANDAPDPDKNRLEVRAIVSPSLRYSLAKARLVNAAAVHKLGIDSCFGGPDNAKDAIDDSHDILINGNNIYIPECAPGDSGVRGGLWLETADGEIVGRCGVTMSGPALLTANLRLDKRPPAGSECNLVMETYGTAEAYDAPDSPLFRYVRKVRFVG